MAEPREGVQFGALAIKLGFTTLDKLDECLGMQERLRALGVAPKKLGELMVEKGYLTAEQVRRIFQHQGASGGHTQLAGYRLETQIGQGAMGRIYKAVQLSMDRVVAVKILAPVYATDPARRERFFREARAVAKLSHPNIIQGIDVGESNGVCYFAMEYIDGPTVGELVQRGGALDEKRAVQLLLQVAKALHAAFQAGITHRDIKPDNILVTREGVAKLCDLGLAKLAADADPVSGQSSPGITLGTPHYISPEQARGEKDIDTRSDIYSLGCTFYHMVVGEVPYPAANAAGAVTRHLTDEIPSARKNNLLVSPQTEFVIRKMMMKTRESRYQSPAEVVSELEKLAAGQNPTGFDAAALLKKASGSGPGPAKPVDDARARLLRKARRLRR